MSDRFKTPSSWNLLTQGPPGLGKSKLLKQLLGKKARRKTRKAWKKWAKTTKFKTFEPLDVTGYLTPPPDTGPFCTPRTLNDIAREFSKEVKSVMDEVTPTSNTRFNVCAMDGTPIPDDVIMGRNRKMELCPDYSDHVARREYHIGTGDIPDPSLLPVHAMDLIEALAGIENADYQPVTTLTSYIKWARDIVTQPGNHDALRAVNDAHSPSWHLDAYLAARKTYHDLLAKADDYSHDDGLDDALRELDRAGTVINRLFGSGLIDGVWDKSKD